MSAALAAGISCHRAGPSLRVCADQAQRHQFVQAGADIAECLEIFVSSATVSVPWITISSERTREDSLCARCAHFAVARIGLDRYVVRIHGRTLPLWQPFEAYLATHARTIACAPFRAKIDLANCRLVTAIT